MNDRPAEQPASIDSREHRHAPERPLHLLWLTENYYPSRGGMAESCDRIVNELRRLGVVVDVVHFVRHASELRVDAKQAGRSLTVPLGDDPAHGLNLLWSRLEADPFRASFTHVVAFGGTTPIVAGPLYAAWLSLPLVTLFRGNDFDAAIFSPKRSDIVRFAIERSACVVSVSSDKARRIAALYPAIPSVTIANGIDLGAWEALPSDLERARAWRAEHVPEGRRVLGMIGHIKVKKGGVFFLSALLASGAAERVHLLIVGDLDAGATAFLAGPGAGLSTTIIPFGDRFDLLTRYPACDLVVIPSFYDGLPNVLLESASLGIPFIASTAGGMGDLLVDGRHGWLFHPGDMHGCRAAVAQAAAADDATLAHMGAECRDMVLRQYDHRTEAATYRDLFAGIGAVVAPATLIPATPTPATHATHPHSGEDR